MWPGLPGANSMDNPSFLSPPPNRFESDLKAMTGHALNWYWKAMWGGVSPLLIISLFVFYLSDYVITGTLQYQAWDASQVCKNTQPRSWAVSFSTWAAVKRVRFHPELPGGLCPLRPLRQGQARLEGMAPEELGGAGTGVYTGVARTEPGTERGTQEAGLHLLTQQRAAHQCFNNLDSRITAPGLRVSLGCPCTDTLIKKIYFLRKVIQLTNLDFFPCG